MGPFCGNCCCGSPRLPPCRWHSSRSPCLGSLSPPNPPSPVPSSGGLLVLLASQSHICRCCNCNLAKIRAPSVFSPLALCNLDTTPFRKKAGGDDELSHRWK